MKWYFCAQFIWDILLKFAICKHQFISLTAVAVPYLWAEEKNDQVKKLTFLLLRLSSKLDREIMTAEKYARKQI